MLKIKIICVGKLKEKYFSDAVREYVRRLNPLCRLEIIEIQEKRLPDRPSPAERLAALKDEGERLRAEIPAGSFFCCLCIEGESLSSEEFSKKLEWAAGSGKSTLCFAIGGSEGLDEQVKAMADLKLSFSKMTFPHHLARVLLLEQLYRAFQISQGTKYHK